MIIRQINWTTLTLTCAIALIGLLFIFSATYSPEHMISLFVKKQLLGICGGIVLYGICALSDYRSLCRYGYFIYYAILALLIFTIVKGSIGMGAQRWINLGIIKFQPSELAKLFLPSFIAFYLYTEPDGNRRSFRTFIPLLAIIGVSFVLILRQPDLGTALLVAFTGIIMLWLAGIGKRFFMLSILACGLSAPILWRCVLKPYQKRRIEVLFGGGDKKKERYHIEQSTIAIGSGGFAGKGFLCGTQTHLSFLPESRTDFIFSVICEEWGFIGALLILLLYLILIVRYLLNICYIRDYHAQLLAIGLLSPVMLSILINVGMVTGILPVVGIPLPLLSYGVTHTWTTFAALGWISGIIEQES